MELPDFIKIILSRDGKQITKNILIYRDGAYYKRSWEAQFALAELSGFVDYNCQFTDLGCRQHRFTSKKAKKEALKAMEGDVRAPYQLMCCCGSCAYAIGYLQQFPNKIEILEEIANCYTERLGFWRMDKGCILPRKYRSTVCLSHRCGEITPKNAGKILMLYVRMTDKEIVEEYKARSGRRYVRSPLTAIKELGKMLLEELKK